MSCPRIYNHFCIYLEAIINFDAVFNNSSYSISSKPYFTFPVYAYDDSGDSNFCWIRGIYYVEYTANDAAWEIIKQDTGPLEDLVTIIKMTKLKYHGHVMRAICLSTAVLKLGRLVFHLFFRKSILHSMWKLGFRRQSNDNKMRFS